MVSRKRRTAPSLALALVSLLLALAGCGGGGGEDASTPAKGGSEGTPAKASPDEPSSPPEPGQGRAAAEPEIARGGEASIEEFGSEAEGAERGEILSVFDGYLNALAAKDYGSACSYLSAAVHESLAQLAGRASDGCAAILPGLLAPTAPRIAREQANGRVANVRVEGDRAFVIFEAPGAELYQLTTVEEDGEWKTTTVAASVLVPDL